MTRFAKHKKAKKSIGEDATPWEELKEPLNEEEKRKEDKRLEKQRKRQLKKVFFFINKKECFINKNFRSVFDVEHLDIQ
jgi:hypothetical protein